MTKIYATLPAPTFEDWFLEMTEELIIKSEKITRQTVHVWENLYNALWDQGRTPEEAADAIILAVQLSL